MDNSSDNLQEKIPLVDRFRGAHGISSVTSIYISESDSSSVEIRTVTIENLVSLPTCLQHVCTCFWLRTLLDIIIKVKRYQNKSIQVLCLLQPIAEECTGIWEMNSWYW